MRMCYRYAYKHGSREDAFGLTLRKLLDMLTGGEVRVEPSSKSGKIKIAIVGAGALGAALAEEISGNEGSPYLPLYFVDNKPAKVKRVICGLEVLPEGDNDTLDIMAEAGVQLVVFAVPGMSVVRRKELYEYYQANGFKVKLYDYPLSNMSSGKRMLREIDVEELLFRRTVHVMEDSTKDYYRGKRVLITGGGGSIGSELCRQIASMEPEELVILDIYENGAYDVQQELRIRYGQTVNLCIEIVSVTDKTGLDRVFESHKPQIVIHAAAHKHVPLMEHNCIEAVQNNVFGTLNVVKCCEEYGAERFMMVSTDKAVNPTNVMGATKRMCEMIVQSYSTHGKVKYSATRFGNVLGSAGSVIPLFKKQIASGGPITITDKRIIRYFMTIPEASQLVLTSGAMAKNGELFVLDMGEPVRIMDLAENMIRLSGVGRIEIVETGLRPGEKLYEDLLVKSETLIKTANKLIFIEKDVPLSEYIIKERCGVLEAACSISDKAAKDALHSVVETFRTPEEVNTCISEG
ncbi:MAG: polysaccharide biosynthesis protein [Selenomonadaceae bacterium]